MTGAGLKQRRHAQARVGAGRPADAAFITGRCNVGSGNRLSDNGRSPSAAWQGTCSGVPKRKMRAGPGLVLWRGADILALALTFLPRRLAWRVVAYLAASGQRRGRAHHVARSRSRVDSSAHCPAN